MSSLPLYIYSTENSGNGRFTNFPSSLHPILKEKFNWSFNENLNNNCNNFVYENKEKKDRHHAKFHMERFLLIFINDKIIDDVNKSKCSVKIENKYLFEKIK